MKDNTATEKTEKNAQKKERVVLFDVLRGLLMVWVMVDHFLYDAAFVFPLSFTTQAGHELSFFAYEYWTGAYRDAVHPLVLLLFFLLSGLVSDFTKNKKKRTLLFWIYTATLTAVTFLVSVIIKEDLTITFGVLFVFAVASTLSLLIETFVKKDGVYFLITLLLGVFFTAIGWIFIKVGAPSYLCFLLHAPYGYTISADYFPLLPYLGYYFFGCFFGRLLYKEKKPYVKIGKTGQAILSPLTFIGKTSLWWYFLSQVAFFAVLYLMTLGGIL